MGSRALSTLSYNGHLIRDRGEHLSLTDMWKAAKSPDHQRPDDWKKDAGNRAFLEHVAMVSNAPVEGIWKGRRGNNGGTWAHWQIALAYAKYLSPEFHMWCNTVVRSVMEGRRDSVGLPSDILEDIKRSFGIMKRTIHKVTAIEQSVAGIVEEAIERRIASDPRVAVVSFVSVKQILADEWKVPAKGRRSIQRKVFVRLQAHCLENGIKAFKCAHSGTWLFPPHEASAFVREHCTGIIRDHLARLNGQTIMRLVPKEQRSPKVRSEVIAEAAATFGPKAAADLSQSI